MSAWMESEKTFATQECARSPSAFKRIKTSLWVNAIMALTLVQMVLAMVLLTQQQAFNLPIAGVLLSASVCFVLLMGLINSLKHDAIMDWSQGEAWGSGDSPEAATTKAFESNSLDMEGDVAALIGTGSGE